MRFLGRQSVLLGLLLAVFVVKGVFLALVFPIFQGPDEQNHYNTVQYRVYQPKFEGELRPNKRTFNGRDITSRSFSEEVVQTALNTQFDQIIFHSRNTPLFESHSDRGPNEAKILEAHWARHTELVPPDVVTHTPLYTSMGAIIENALRNQDIFTRFFSLRFLSVLFGVLTVCLVYLIARELGFGKRVSLLAASLAAFQPMFSFISAIVNPDALLILAFTLFTYGGVLLLKGRRIAPGLFWLFVSLPAAYFAKGTGVLLLLPSGFLLFVLLYRYLPLSGKFFRLATVLSLFLIVATIGFALLPNKHVELIKSIPATAEFDSFGESVVSYLDKTITFDALRRTHASYWGHFGWLDTKLPAWQLNILLATEIFLFLGLARFFYRAGARAKLYILFFLAIVLSLQLGIRFYDWNHFKNTGQIAVGQPGRYFLPGLAAHMMLLLYGACGWFGSLRRLRVFLLYAVVFLALLSLYAVFGLIIPRYYL